MVFFARNKFYNAIPNLVPPADKLAAPCIFSGCAVFLASLVPLSTLSTVLLRLGSYYQ